MAFVDRRANKIA